jgi:hypothetical protein
MTANHARNKPTVAFSLTPEHIALIDRLCEEYHIWNRSWVVGRILDLFTQSPKNLTITSVTIGEQAALDRERAEAVA